MAQYDIDRAFMQRFIHSLEDPKIMHHYDRIFNSAINAGEKMLFIAQFDNMDEGTQIFKCSQHVPAGKSPFISYEQGIETDHYLWLTREIGRLLGGEIGISSKPPKR